MTNALFALALLAAAPASSPSQAPSPAVASTSGSIAVTTPAPGAAGSTVAAPGGLEFTWLGQSCFVMRTPGKTTVLMDPLAYEIGYKPPTVKADLVTISHEHPDHDNLKMVEVAGAAAGGAEVIRGLTRNGWADVDESVGDVHVTSIHTFHDDQRGKKYGRNTVFVFDVGGRRVVHLGDLGHMLDAKQIADLGRVDVLMIPVGGNYTLDGASATKLVAAIKPRYVVFPMHYKTPQLKIRELADATAFLAGKTNVVTSTKSTWTVPDAKAPVPAEPTIVVLTPGGE